MMSLLDVLLSGFKGGHAYLDPGSGSFLFQILIAVILGLGVFLRASWGSIRKLFGKRPASDENEDVENDDAE